MTKMQTVAGTPAADFSFFPDPARAVALDGAMHAALAESLRHLAEHLSPEEATGPDHVAGLIEGGARLRPTAFGHYFELAFALLHEDAATATTSATALTAERPAPKGLRIGHMGGGEEDALYLRRLGGSNFDFLPPEPEMAAAFEERFAAGRALLSAEVPELAGEIDAIVREVRLATGDPEAPMQFDGGSAYQLWGLLLLNPRFHPDPLAVAEVLAHEAGHLLLFGFTIDEPLARNPDEDLFPSPLRVDPRPMDGIYHATFVSARMAWAMDRMAASTRLDGETRARAAAAAEADARNFAAGHSVVAEHGILTETGRALMEGARQFMAGRGATAGPAAGATLSTAHGGDPQTG